MPLAAVLWLPGELSFQWRHKSHGWIGTGADLNFCWRNVSEDIFCPYRLQFMRKLSLPKTGQHAFLPSKYNADKLDGNYFRKTGQKFSLCKAFQMFHICRIKMKTLIFVVWTCLFGLLFLFGLNRTFMYMNSDLIQQTQINPNANMGLSALKAWLRIWGFWHLNSGFSSCFETHLGWTQNEFYKCLPRIFIELVTEKSFLKRQLINCYSSDPQLQSDTELPFVL